MDGAIRRPAMEPPGRAVDALERALPDNEVCPSPWRRPRWISGALRLRGWAVQLHVPCAREVKS